MHLLFALEKVRPDHSLTTPDVDESEPFDSFRAVALPALIRMKLTSFRTKDRMHLFDLIDVGLIDESTADGLPDELAARLRELIANPDG